jgi:predicted GH43/DUF377 family glycosyl hydrolase
MSINPGLKVKVLSVLVLGCLFAVCLPLDPVEAQGFGPQASSRDDSNGWGEEFSNGTTSLLDRTVIIDGKVQLDFEPYMYTKYPGNPVLSASSGHFDSAGMRMNTVLKEGGLLKMWYGGYDGTHWRIGYATSVDGVNWTRQNSGNSVIDIGSPGEFDNEHVGIPYVINDSGTYKMWYGAHDGVNWQIGYATSSDGISWSKYANNPVMNVQAGTYYSVQIYPGPVRKENGKYKMWLTGNDGNKNVGSRISYATSDDGVTWNINPKPIMDTGPVDSFDSVATQAANVWWAGSKYYMIYTGYDGTIFQLGTAESTGGIVWKKLNNNDPILKIGAPGSWDDFGLLESSRYQVGGRLFLLYGALGTADNLGLGLALANYYKEGFAISQKVDLPSGMAWDNVTIKKTEPAGTSINISVIDPGTQQPISGFEDLRGLKVNLSVLNGNYSSIMIRARFAGDGNSTPYLDSWNISWSVYDTPIVTITSPKDEDLLDAAPFLMNGTVYFPAGGDLSTMDWSADGGPWTSMTPALNWSVTIPLLSSGKHVLVVRATGTNGLNGTDSILIVIKYPQKMLCVITYPREGQEVAGIIPIRGYAFDPGGIVTKGTLKVGLKTTSFEIQLGRWKVNYDFRKDPAGKTALIASINDGKGNSASDNVNVTVIPAPKVKILYPLNGTRIMNTTFEGRFRIESSGTGVLGLTLFIDGHSQYMDTTPGLVSLTLTTPEAPGNFTVIATISGLGGEGSDTTIPNHYFKPKPYKTMVIPVPWWVFVTIGVLSAIVVIYDYVKRDPPMLGSGPGHRRRRNN